MEKSLGQVAYEAWLFMRPNWEDKHPWWDLPGSDRRGWEDVAQAVLTAQRQSYVESRVQCTER